MPDVRDDDAAWRCDIAGAIANLTCQLAYESPMTRDRAAAWLDQLRVIVRADDALVWSVSSDGATVALCAGRSCGEHRAADVTGHGRVAVDRLRRNGLVCCDGGDVSGLEDFVPAGARSFVVAGANRHDRLASVLVLGWGAPLPACGPHAFAQLRIAAALFGRTVDPAGGSDAATTEEAERQATKDGRVAARLLAVQEAERSRIARELHDDLGQQVAVLDTVLETAVRHRASRTQVDSALMETRVRLQEIASTIHGLAHSLHPAKLKLLGLVTTLQALCREVAVETKHAVEFEATDVPSDLDEQVVLCIFRVAQEALQNVVKHSGAGTIAVHLVGTAESLHLRIIDDGSGFDPVVSPSAGLGLLTMRERVELIGGTLTVTSVPARGTTIDASVSTKRRAEII